MPKTSSFSRDDFKAIVRESINALRESAFEIHDPEVKVLGPGAAVIPFRLHETLIDKSENTTIINGMLFLVYERRNDQWQIVLAHESLSGNEELQE
jgi:hypothetical protein